MAVYDRSSIPVHSEEWVWVQFIFGSSNSSRLFEANRTYRPTP